jgi:hypothetical protein
MTKYHDRFASLNQDRQMRGNRNAVNRRNQCCERVLPHQFQNQVLIVNSMCGRDIHGFLDNQDPSGESDLAACDVVGSGAVVFLARIKRSR